MTLKVKDMRGDPRVGQSVIDHTNPHRMAMLQGQRHRERPDEYCQHMDPIRIRDTGAPFPSAGPDRRCLVTAIDQAASRTLDPVHARG